MSRPRPGCGSPGTCARSGAGSGTSARSWPGSRGTRRPCAGATSCAGRTRSRDLVALEATREAVGAGRAALGPASLTAETAVGLLTRLPADVAEMVALRVVLGLDSGDTGSLVGARPGSVIVAVHSGLRRTSNLVGAAAAHAAGPAGSPVAPNPWTLDRLLDLGADGRGGLDPAMRAVVTALAEPGHPGDLRQLAPARAAFDRTRQRSFGLLPVLLLPELARRLAATRNLVTGKVAAVAVGTAVLSAPAALAHSDPLATPPAQPQAIAAPNQTAATGLVLSVAHATTAAARQPVPAKAPRSSGSVTTRSTPSRQQVHRPAAARAEPRPQRASQVGTGQHRHHHRPWWLIRLLRRA